MICTKIIEGLWFVLGKLKWMVEVVRDGGVGNECMYACPVLLRIVSGRRRAMYRIS